MDAINNYNGLDLIKASVDKNDQNLRDIMARAYQTDREIEKECKLKTDDNNLRQTKMKYQLVMGALSRGDTRLAKTLMAQIINSPNFNALPDSVQGDLSKLNEKLEGKKPGGLVADAPAEPAGDDMTALLTGGGTIC